MELWSSGIVRGATKKNSTQAEPDDGQREVSEPSGGSKCGMSWACWAPPDIDINRDAHSQDIGHYQQCQPKFLNSGAKNHG